MGKEMVPGGKHPGGNQGPYQIATRGFRRRPNSFNSPLRSRVIARLTAKHRQQDERKPNQAISWASPEVPRQTHRYLETGAGIQPASEHFSPYSP